MWCFPAELSRVARLVSRLVCVHRSASEDSNPFIGRALGERGGDSVIVMLFSRASLAKSHHFPAVLAGAFKLIQTNTCSCATR